MAVSTQTRSRALGALRRVPALNVLLGAVVALGIGARITRIAWPRRFTFDEHHFVENARNYLNGKADWNDHPPLGKLFEAVSILGLGDNALAWRLPSLVLGLGSLGCAYVLGRELFGSVRAGLLAAALLATDGFFIAYSRTALIDGQLVFLALAAVAIAVKLPHARGLALSGLFVGLATSIKFTGVCTWVPVLAAVAVFGSRRALVWGLPLALFGFLAAYLGQWFIGLELSGKDLGPWGGFAETARLLEGHARATAATHPLTSSWPTWLLPRRPITLYWKDVRGTLFVLTTLGNPLTWWLTSLACLVTSSQLVWFGARPVVMAKGDAAEPSGFWSRQGRAAVVLLAGWLAFLAPWMLTRRDPYIYHYLPAYAFGVLLLAAYLDHLFQRRPRWALGVLGAIVLVAFFYAPVWMGYGLDRKALDARLFLESWR